ERESVMVAIATARTHCILIMRHLQCRLHSALRQPEISPLTIVTPSASHRIPVDGTFNNVVYSLAVVALGVKLHRDRAGLGLERYFRDRQISEAGTDNSA